jgi:hypothetical protein
VVLAGAAFGLLRTPVLNSFETHRLDGATPNFLKTFEMADARRKKPYANMR